MTEREDVKCDKKQGRKHDEEGECKRRKRRRKKKTKGNMNRS